MDSNKSLFWNKAMFWGFIVGVASVTITTLSYVTDNMESSFMWLFSMAIYIGGITLCARAFKKSSPESEPFPYSRALGLGVATMLFASIILAVYNFVLYKFIAPDLIEKILTASEEQALRMGTNEDMIEQQMEFFRNLYTPFFMSIGSIFGGVFWGLIISLVTSIFLQKKVSNPFETAMNEIDDEE